MFCCRFEIKMIRKYRYDKPGAAAQSVACTFRKQRSRVRSSYQADSFVEKLFISSADSRRASCQLLSKEWALNTENCLREACPGAVFSHVSN